MSIAGKYLTAKINGTVVSGNYAWNAREASKLLSRQTGSDNGFTNEDPGSQSIVVDLKGYMDIATGQYTPVQAGTLITNLYLYRDENDATAAYELPSAVVAESTQGGEVEGKVEWTASIHNKGTYNYGDP